MKVPIRLPAMDRVRVYTIYFLHTRLRGLFGLFLWLNISVYSIIDSIQCSYCLCLTDGVNNQTDSKCTYFPPVAAPQSRQIRQFSGITLDLYSGTAGYFESPTGHKSL
jgi:hypothetical protein